MFRFCLLTACFLACSLAGTLSQAEDAAASTKLLRFPDLHGEHVVFTYAGDLWLAPSDGGVATRLTAHPGLELFARFSPDGRWIAFTGQYDGDEQVYVVPTAGGSPRRLTNYPAWGPLPARWGYDHQVYGWTRDSKRVLFRSLRFGWTLTDSRLFTVSVDGGLPEPLPMPVSGAGELSPDGRRVVYSPLFRDFRTWKRYQGGWAQDLWIFDLEKSSAKRLTSHPRTERDPMWIGEKVYYASDADGTLNLYSHDPKTSEKTQLTTSKTWDVRWPAADSAGRIVYEFGGGLSIYDTKTKKSRSIDIRVPDDGLTRRPSHVSVARQIADYALSPKGKRALVVARGDVFSVPSEHGPTRNLTGSSDAHDKAASWSPNGKHVVCISDRTGEEELWLLPQDGRGEATQLTFGGTMMRYSPRWSPDSKRIAFSDKSGRIRVVSLEDRQVEEVADDASGRAYDHVWSPCSTHLAFSLSDSNEFRSLWIWSAGAGAARRVTEEAFNEFSPAWGPDGKYLYYFSDREFAPQIGSIEWNYATDRESGIFVLALRKDVPHPFPPRSDEVELPKEPSKDDKIDSAGDEEKKAEGKDEKAADEKCAPIVIDFDGLDRRVARVPVPFDNMRGPLSVVEGHLLYVRSTPFYYGRSAGRSPAIMAFSFEKRKAKPALEGAGSYRLSADGKRALVRHSGAVKIFSVPGFDAANAKTLPTSGLVVDRVPAQEWEQIFDEVWRRFRDFFYVANMHGYDWKALRDRYRPLLAHVAHRSDLNYLIGEMIAELNVSHAYITGGEWEEPKRAKVALLGARIELDKGSGRFRIAEILRGHNEEPIYRSPLTEIGVDVSEGAYLLAVDGEELEATDNPYLALRHKADRPVTLTVNDRPALEGSREVVVRSVQSETDLNYLSWVMKNRERVAKATNGRIGYLHVPDMGSAGIREFIKWYYGQVRKEGLIVDVRNNGGGNVSQMLIERLGRELLGTGYSRNNDRPGTYPAVVFHGHMVCILNSNSASDGDIFPHMFRKAGLGPLIGVRSWGGVIGITNRGTLVDGGQVSVPEYGFNATDGSWIVEGYGVDPDIIVEQEPSAVIQGRDPQLERAIQEVLKRVEAEPKKLPKRPADPVRTK